MAKVMAVQSYLVHLRDRQLALAVGAGLEDRLARDGRDAVALVSRADGPGLTRAEGTGRRASRGSYRDAPQVVALYEEGLLAKLESLGLTAYVGVHPDEEPGTIRWGNGGAMLLPVATARELIDAVATHTPWATHAARLTKRTFAMPAALPRKLAVTGIVGPMLLAGLPGTAAAATAPQQPTAKTAGTPMTTTAFATTLAPQAAQSPVSSNNQVFLNRIDSAIRFYLAQTHQALANNDNATRALENQILRLVNAFINSQGGASSPGAPTQGGSPGGRQGGSPGGQAGGQQPPSGQGGSQQSPGGQGGGSQPGGGGQRGGGGKSGGGGKGGGQGQQNQSPSQSQSQSPSQNQSPSASQNQSPSASQNQSPSASGQQGFGSGQGMTGSGGGTSAYGPGASSGGGPSSSGGNSSGGASSGGASSGGGSSS